MTLDQLKQDNPGIYAQVIEQATELGIQQERERCIALLPSNVNDPVAVYAIKCIKDGSPLGCKQKANYLCMQINALHKEKRAKQEADIVTSIVEAKLGVNRDGNVSH